MRKPKITDSLIGQRTTIKKAMQTIDHAGIGIGFIVDAKGRLIGSVTNDDIRKAILKGVDISEGVAKIMDHDPAFLFESELDQKDVVLEKIGGFQASTDNCSCIPVVGTNKKIKSLSSCSELVNPDHGYQLKKCVLVVGGAGYLGSVLCQKLLDRGYKVKILDLLLFGKEPVKRLLTSPHATLIKGDMRNISTVVQALNGVDAVINLAAIVGDPACQKSPADAIETNYLANKLLAEASKYNQINRFIYASTCSVYGKGESELDESSDLNPVSLYARSKIQSEDAILSLIDENFSPCILRMSTLYGLSPRMRFDLVVNTMTMTAVIDKKINIFGGKQWRPLLHISDAADAYIKCLETPIGRIKGKIFNVGSNDQNFRINQVGRIVNAGVPDSELIIQEDLSDPRDYIVSFNRIRKELRYSPKVTIAAAVKEIRRALESKLIKNVKHAKYYNVGEN